MEIWPTTEPIKRNAPPQYNAQPRRHSLDNTLQAFMETQTKTNQKVGSALTQLMEENKEIKSQITKLTLSLAIQQHGRFPSQPQSNQRGQNMAQTSNVDDQNVKEVNAITTRSDKLIER